MRPSPKASDGSAPRSEGGAIPAPDPAAVGSIAATSTGRDGDVERGSACSGQYLKPCLRGEEAWLVFMLS